MSRPLRASHFAGVLAKLGKERRNRKWKGILPNRQKEFLWSRLKTGPDYEHSKHSAIRAGGGDLPAETIKTSEGEQALKTAGKFRVAVAGPHDPDKEVPTKKTAVEPGPIMLKSRSRTRKHRPFQLGMWSRGGIF